MLFGVSKRVQVTFFLIWYFLRAELNEQQLNNPARAREGYERILLDYPVSLYADRARKRYNALKNTLP